MTSPSSSCTNNKKTAGGAALRLATAALVALATGTNAAMYMVSPDRNPMSLTDALDVAGAGDIISLADGIYREPIVTMNAGVEGNPLVITGGRGAVINYFSGDREEMWSQKVVDIRHSYVTLEGFTIDGWLDDQDEEESYIDKCIFVEGQAAPTMLTHEGQEVESALIGTVIDGLKIQNCGMECIRMRNFVTNAVIQNNDIEDCGIYDFRFQFDGKIGEAIYIGTSSNQWTDGTGDRVTNGPDGSNYNLVTGNKLVPRGNECVDIKEGATMNVVEYNECEDQRDEESGCYDSRGNENTFRYNTAVGCLGAGIRLGGHTIDGFVYGVDNHVYGNEFLETEAGSIKSRVEPQGVICDNTCAEGECGVSEEGDDEEIEGSWDQQCPSSLPSVPFIDDLDTPTAPAPSPEVAPTPEVAAPAPHPTGSQDEVGPTMTSESESESESTTTMTSESESESESTTTMTSESGSESPMHTTCNGVLSGMGYYCCAASCGICGGEGCSRRNGGADGCCTSSIESSGAMCEETSGVAPCIVEVYLG